MKMLMAWNLLCLHNAMYFTRFSTIAVFFWTGLYTRKYFTSELCPQTPQSPFKVCFDAQNSTVYSKNCRIVDRNIELIKMCLFMHMCVCVCWRLWSPPWHLGTDSGPLWEQHMLIVVLSLRAQRVRVFIACNLCFASGYVWRSGSNLRTIFSFHHLSPGHKLRLSGLLPWAFTRDPPCWSVNWFLCYEIMTSKIYCWCLNFDGQPQRTLSMFYSEL